ncbi:reverse transcriptase zinc-binding domain-containing protein [Artemisia annua]|uniref:Reverse transcriptase zinc-binding domain-containing protein n=1 Tax=Artemisia annua TaxID=35608 RepID=A0A2U1NWP3_ARTAN|nr:reverse transcriptase zinc-binding domain-containing protein [Artemisia annua]
MGNFTVKSARLAIDKKLLISDTKVTRWSKLVPIKVNVMGWRLSIDKLPTRVNLDARGIDILSVLCPVCGECTESTSHIFFECSFVSQVYKMFERWWDIHIPETRCYQQWLDWFLALRLHKVQKAAFGNNVLVTMVACVVS